MEKQDLKNLLENIYHLLAEEGEWHAPLLAPPDPYPIPMAPPPPWLSPLDPNPTPIVDPVLNPEGPGGGTIRELNGRRLYVFPNGRVLIWNDELGRWLIFRYPMLGDYRLPFPTGERLPGQALGGELWPTWLGGLHTPEEWLEIINRSPWFSPNSPNP